MNAEFSRPGRKSFILGRDGLRAARLFIFNFRARREKNGTARKPFLPLSPDSEIGTADSTDFTDFEELVGDDRTNLFVQVKSSASFARNVSSSRTL